MRRAASAMNARVAGERCALRRVMNANVSMTGGSKVVLCRGRANVRPRAPWGVPAARERAPERHLARADGVAEAARGELERRLDVLDLDLGLERHARALGAVGELAAGGVRPAEARVIEDQRRLREALDRHGLADPLGS